MRRPALLVLLCLLLPPTPAVRSGEGEVKLLTDETIPLYLSRGRELARSQQWETMIDVLQRIVIGDPKVFSDLKAEVLNAAVYSEDGVLYYPARELCIKELAAMPPEGLRAYRTRYDNAARDLYAQARRTPDVERRIAAYGRVFDAYLVSSVGDDALLASGDLNLELGRYYEALALYRRLVEVYPRDTDRDLAMVLAKAAYCAARIGDREHRDVLLERLASEYPSARIPIEDRPVAAGALADHPALALRDSGSRVSDADWALPGGNPARARVIDDLPEEMPREPFWRFRLAQRDPSLFGLYGSWVITMQDRAESERPAGRVHHDYDTPYPTVRPVLYDGLVVYKDCLELVARRVGSGTFFATRGRYALANGDAADASDDPTFRFPVRYVRPGTEHGRQGDGQNEDIHRFLDYGGNTVVASGDQFFTVENSKALAYLRDYAVPTPGRPNLLVTYSRIDGKTLWAWNSKLCARGVKADPEALAEWTADFQLHHRPTFRGPGVASGGMLYTVAFERDGQFEGVALWAFGLRDGRVRFRTLLHQPDKARQRMPVGAALAVAGGVVYVQTGGGILAAVDSLPPGRIRWISRYRRNFLQTRNNRKLRNRRGAVRRSSSRIFQGFAYNDPVVVAGKVIIAAPDSNEIVAFHAETGRVAWRIGKDSGPLKDAKIAHIVGVSNGILVMAGAAVCGIDVARGEVVWGPDLLLSGFAYGRGLVGRKYAYVPTMRPDEKRAAIHRFDLLTGAEAEPLRFNVERLGNLLSVDGRLIVANEEEVMCFTTAKRELEAMDRRIAREGESGRALMERAAILARAKRPAAEVTRTYLRAAEVAATSGEKPKPVRRAALDHLFARARSGGDLDALAQARTILAQAAAEEARQPMSRMRAYEAQAAFLEARILARRSKAHEAFGALERFLDDHAGDFVVVDRTKVRRGAEAAKELRDALIGRDREFAKVFFETVRARIEAAYEKGDADALRAIGPRYGHVPPTEESHFALARLYEAQGKTVEAEIALRNLIERFSRRTTVAEAHLRLARILLKKGLAVEARVERNKAVSRMDEPTRARLSDLLAEVDRGLPAPGQPTIIPRLSLPLRRTGFATPGVAGVAVRISGDRGQVPDDLVVIADETAYYAFDLKGELVWKQSNPVGAGVRFGRPDDATTTVVASAVANRRFAFATGGRIVIGDLFGLTCVDAKSGKVFWQRPRVRANAARDADKSLAALRADLARLRSKDDLQRGGRLPAYAQSGGAVVSAHPLRGVEVFDIASGELIWQDPEVSSPIVGPPQIMGQLLAVGWAHPGRVRIYGMADGRVYQEYAVAGKGPLLAPPVLDPLGRLLVVEGRDRSLGTTGLLRILDARSGRDVHGRTYEVRGRYAALLHADGRTAVFHDGGSGGLNLHFIDLSTRRSVVIRAGADILREVEVVQDGARLFVFTHTPGVPDLAARLVRIDVEGRDLLSYDPPPPASAYARPLLTANHVVVASWGGTGARLRLYDRDASSDSRRPRAVFTRGGVLVDEFEAQFAGKANYTVPPAVAVVRKSLWFGHPYGAARFLGPDAR